MERWRKLLAKLGLARQSSGPRETADAARQADGVTPGEIALILLKNALRLLDQSSAPLEVRTSLVKAISELEQHIAARSG